MLYYGGEMMFEICRFWASLTTWNPERERFEIRRVMGPDEYHDAYPDAEEPGLDNNAYTNVMVSWLLARALDVLGRIPEYRRAELCDVIDLTPDEIARWDEISRKLYVPFHDNGIISQFEGYDRLEEFDWEGYRKKYGDIQRLDRILESEGDSTNRYKLSKQADVLMLFYLLSAEELQTCFERLGYGFDTAWIPKNVEYYSARTSHGSTLSGVVHAWVLARTDRPRSWELFLHALNSDITDIQGGTTAEGIHLGAMAGTVDLAQRGYTGIEARGDLLRVNPAMPDEMKRLQLSLRYRMHWLDVEISRQGYAAPIRIDLDGNHRMLECGKECVFDL